MIIMHECIVNYRAHALVKQPELVLPSFLSFFVAHEFTPNVLRRWLEVVPAARRQSSESRWSAAAELFKREQRGRAATERPASPAVSPAPTPTGSCRTRERAESRHTQLLSSKRGIISSDTTTGVGNTKTNPVHHHHHHLHVWRWVWAQGCLLSLMKAPGR